MPKPPNAPDQRPGANGSRIETEASSPGSLHLVCWAFWLALSSVSRMMWNMHQVDPTGLLPTPARCRRLAWLNRMLRSGLTLEEIEAKRWSKDSGEYSIYCLAENGKRVRYIGITNQSAEVRLRQHLADCGRGRNLYKENWIRSCVSKGVPVTIHIVRSGLPSDRACMIEFELIRFFKRPFALVNTHAGGATGYAGLSEESREKHRINTEKGLMASWEREQEAIDMARGYCLLEEWEWVEDEQS